MSGKNVKVTITGEKSGVELIAKYFAIKDGVKVSPIARIAGRTFHLISKVEFFEITNDGYTSLATVNVDNVRMVHNVTVASDKSTFQIERSKTVRGKSDKLTVDNLDIGTDIEKITSAVFDKLGLSNKPQSEVKVLKSENDQLKAQLDQLKAQLDQLMKAQAKPTKPTKPTASKA